MNLELKKELPIIGIVIIPFIYLASIWKNLPERIPINWNMDGEIAHWGSKIILILVVCMLPVLTYTVLFAAAKFDPKNRTASMGKKFSQLKFFLVLFKSLLALIIIYITKNQSFSDPALMYVLVGVLLMIMGNYFKVIRPGYFIGIRTPWTLENEEVWKATHVFAGKIWLFGGLIIVLGGITFSGFVFSKALVTIGFIVAFLPVAYSFFKYRQLEKKQKKL